MDRPGWNQLVSPNAGGGQQLEGVVGDQESAVAGLLGLVSIQPKAAPGSLVSLHLSQ